MPPSLVAKLYLRAHVAFLFQSLYNMPGLAPYLDVLFWGQRDIQISFSNRDTSRNALDRYWWSSIVYTGILSKNMTFPFHECKTTFWSKIEMPWDVWHSKVRIVFYDKSIANTKKPSLDQTFNQTMTLLLNLTFTDSREVCGAFAKDVAL